MRRRPEPARGRGGRRLAYSVRPRSVWGLLGDAFARLLDELLGEVADLPGLNPPEVDVQSVLRDEVVVGAVLGDLAVIEHENRVGIAHRREPVGDRKGGPIGGEVVDRALDQELSFGIDRRGRLVEDQDRGVPEDGLRDGDALALPSPRV